MPRVRLTKVIRINGQPVRGWAEGIMVEEGDRLTVIDPANNNDLIKGMTKTFAEKLIRDGLMVMVDTQEHMDSACAAA